MRRIADGEATLRHVRDEHNPADFLTKWIGMRKLEKSIAFAENTRAAVQPRRSNMPPPAIQKRAARRADADGFTPVGKGGKP